MSQNWRRTACRSQSSGIIDLIHVLDTLIGPVARFSRNQIHGITALAQCKWRFGEHSAPVARMLSGIVSRLSRMLSDCDEMGQCIMSYKLSECSPEGATPESCNKPPWLRSSVWFSTECSQLPLKLLKKARHQTGQLCESVYPDTADSNQQLAAAWPPRLILLRLSRNTDDLQRLGWQ